MTAGLPVFAAVAAPPALSGWLRRLLMPVLAACRFERAVALEIRPTGRWRGWSAYPDYAPDGRVVLSSRVCFWTAENIISVYLHECCHRLLNGLEVASHGPEFFCLNAILLMRASQFFKADAVQELGLYDLSDCPPELQSEPGWRGLVLNFSLAAAEELAATELAAEELPGRVLKAWQQWLEQRQRDHDHAVLQARKAAQTDNLLLNVEELNNSIFLWKWMARIAFVWCFLLIIFSLTFRIL